MGKTLRRFQPVGYSNDLLVYGNSAELHKRRTAAVARGVSSMVPSDVDSAGPGTLIDVDGREWVDFTSGIAVTA